MSFKNIIQFSCAEYASELERIVAGLTDEERRFTPHPDSHHIDFIVWHIARVEDTWINSFAKQAIQIWDEQKWAMTVLNKYALSPDAFGVTEKMM